MPAARTVRRLLTTVVAGATAAAVMAAPSVGSGASGTTVRTAPDATTQARAALDEVERILGGNAGVDRTRPDAAPPHLTPAMVRLVEALPDLSDRDRADAEVLLARPTDGFSDPLGDGYTSASTRRCTSDLCLHWATSGADAPPGGAWINTTLNTLQSVHRFETGTLGYRKPVLDPGGARNGGDARFDVYLKQLGTRGIYGYCVPEYLVNGFDGVASGYCVLDNDFAEFRGRPIDNLEVTAAHEYFHAIQFAYDYTDDPWMAEASAAWMEERFADAVNDNRQYLPRSQVRNPDIPLDLFEQAGVYHYGQWAFFEYLTERFNRNVVKQIYQAARDKGAGKRNKHSMQAISQVLKKRGGLTKLFTQYSAANIDPRRNYPEGRAWPKARLEGAKTLSRGSRKYFRSTRLDHLSSATVRLTPNGSLSNKKWRVRVTVRGPKRFKAPGAQVTVVKKNNRLDRRYVKLNKSGRGKVVVPISKRKVKRVFVTVANASTRTRCNRGSGFTCEGSPRDENQRFTIQAKVV